MISPAFGLKRYLIRLLSAGLLLSCIKAGTALAEENGDQSFISTGIGYYDFFADDEDGEFRVEYR